MAKETEILEYLIRVETELAKAKDAANALGNVDKETKKVEKSLDRTEKQSKKTEAAMNGIKRAAIGLVGYHALKGVTVESNRTALAFEAIDAKMAAAFGTMEKGRRESEFARREAYRLGKDIIQLSNSYGDLAASSRGTNLEGEATRKIFVAVTEAMTVLKKTGPETEGALRAISQMMSKGKISAEELVGQLSERLPGSLNIASRAMRASNAELYKMLENGELLAEDFLPKFANELSRTYGPQLTHAIDSAAAKQARFNNVITEGKAALGGYIIAGIDPYITKIGEAIQAMNEVRSIRGNLSEEQAMALAKENDALAENVKLRLQLMQFAGDPSAGRKIAELEGLQERQYQKVTRGINRFGNKNPFGGHLKKETVTVADAEYAQRFRSFLDNNAEAGIYKGAEAATPQQPVIEATQKAIDLQQKLTLATLSGFDQQRKAASYLFEERASQIDDLFSKKQIDEDKRRQLNQLNVDAHRLKNEQIEEAEREHQERLKQIREDASEEEVRRIRLTSEQIENIRTESEEMFAAGMTDALLSFVDGTEKAEDAFKKFASSFLREIARMIIQQQILNAVRAASSYLRFADGGTSTLADGGVRYAAAGMTSAARPTYNARHNVIYGEAGREMLAVLARPRTMSIGGASAVVGRVGGSRVAMMNANDLPTMAANGAINGDGVPRSGAAGGGGFGGNLTIRMISPPGWEAEIIEAGGMRGLQIVTEHTNSHTKLRTSIHRVSKSG